MGDNTHIRHRLSKIYRQPRAALHGLVRRTLESVTLMHNFLRPLPQTVDSGSDLDEISEIRKHALVRTDICDHLVTLFAESLAVQPRLIVELGVRTGESTFALERVAKLCGSVLVSVDIDDCLRASPWGKWNFVKNDDIAFACQFPEWCRVREIQPEIDVLLIDTSHIFDHTVQEIAHWFPLLSKKAKVFFHDTNQRRIYFRRDKSMGIGSGTRGVVAALEDYLGVKLNEKVSFTDFRRGWIIRHDARCSGFTILEKLNSKSETWNMGRAS
jgi:cephalosporin hydroxylase